MLVTEERTLHLSEDLNEELVPFITSSLMNLIDTVTPVLEHDFEYGGTVRGSIEEFLSDYLKDNEDNFLDLERVGDKELDISFKIEKSTLFVAIFY